MTKKTRILFVCLGNICRSPAAGGIFQDMLVGRGVLHRFEVDSAGTYGGHAGELPDSRMRAAAARRGYQLTHRARRFCSDDFFLFDKIVVMDDANFEAVAALSPDPAAEQKICRMADFCRQFAVDHVPDPYYEGQRGFEYVLDILEDACANLLEELLKQ
jgi:protein-tyrosine phosphatase